MRKIVGGMQRWHRSASLPSPGAPAQRAQGPSPSALSAQLAAGAPPAPPPPPPPRRDSCLSPVQLLHGRSSPSANIALDPHRICTSSNYMSKAVQCTVWPVPPGSRGAGSPGPSRTASTASICGELQGEARSGGATSPTRHRGAAGAAGTCGRRGCDRQPAAAAGCPELPGRERGLAAAARSAEEGRVAGEGRPEAGPVRGQSSVCLGRTTFPTEQGFHIRAAPAVAI